MKMNDEVNKGGRPRKYATNAERQKAYYERKKKRIKELEKKLASLDGNLETDSTPIKNLRKKIDIKKASFSWKKYTSRELALIGEKELKRLITSFNELIDNNSVLMESILNLIITTLDIDYSGSLTDISNKDLEHLDKDINTIIQFSKENNQQQTFLYLLEAELESRQRSIEREIRLDILEVETQELLKDKKRDEIKVIHK
ncbi:MAG: hypothetical protein FK734_21085 [Asgard group archaeon]|nr:hypothetical protein [Asgard group archaeon]